MGIYISLLKNKSNDDSEQVKGKNLSENFRIVLNALLYNGTFRPKEITLWEDFAEESLGKKIRTVDYDQIVINEMLTEFENLITQSINSISEQKSYSIEVQGYFNFEKETRFKNEITGFLISSWNTEFEQEVGDIHFDSYSFFGMEFVDFFRVSTKFNYKLNLDKITSIWNYIINKSSDIDKMVFGEDPNSHMYLLGASWYYFKNPLDYLKVLIDMFKRTFDISESDRTFLFNQLKIIQIDSYLKRINEKSKIYSNKFLLESILDDDLLKLHNQYAKEFKLIVDTSHSLNVSSEAFNPEITAEIIERFAVIIDDIFVRSLEDSNDLKQKIKTNLHEVVNEKKKFPGRLDKYIP